MTTTQILARVLSVRNGSGAEMSPSFISAMLTAPMGSKAREISSRLTNCGMAIEMTKSVRHIFFIRTSLWLRRIASSIPSI